MTMIYISSNPEAPGKISGVDAFRNGSELQQHIIDARDELPATSNTDMQQTMFAYTDGLNLIRAIDKQLESQGASPELLEHRMSIYSRVAEQQMHLATHNALDF